MNYDDLESARAAWRRSGLLVDEVLGGTLQGAVSHHPNTPFTWISRARPDVATLSELYEQGIALAHGLKNLGVAPGDVVACQLPNWLEGAVSLVGAFAGGFTFLPIVHIYGAAELRQILTTSRARVLITAQVWKRSNFVDRLAEVLPLPELEHVIVVDGDGHNGHLSWRSVVESGTPNPLLPEPSISADDTCALIYTSGTSGGAKGLRHSHNSLRAAIRASVHSVIGPGLSFEPQPAGHIANLMTVLGAMVVGRPLVQVDEWDAKTALEICNRFQPYFMGGSPTYFLSLYEAEAAGEASPWPQVFATGGNSVPPEVITDAYRNGRIGFRMYGSSEVPAATLGRLTDSLVDRSETDGIPNPGCEFRIVDSEENNLRDDGVGEVLLRAPQMFQGYLQNSLNEEAITRDGWFRTGDLGRFNDSGRLIVTGRKKDIIIRGGENISAREVEEVVTRHPAIDAAVAISVPDSRYGERVCCVVRLIPGASISLDSLRTHFKEQGFAIQKTPEQLVEWEGPFPITSTGKVKKNEVRDRVMHGASARTLT